MLSSRKYLNPSKEQSSEDNHHSLLAETIVNVYFYPLTLKKFVNQFVNHKNFCYPSNSKKREKELKKNVLAMTVNNVVMPAFQLLLLNNCHFKHLYLS